MTARCKLCRCVNEVDEDGFCYQCKDDIRLDHVRGDDTNEFYEHQKQEDI
jgi:hypothetical protein